MRIDRWLALKRTKAFCLSLALAAIFGVQQTVWAWIDPGNDDGSSSPPASPTLPPPPPQQPPDDRPVSSVPLPQLPGDSSLDSGMPSPGGLPSLPSVPVLAIQPVSVDLQSSNATITSSSGLPPADEMRQEQMAWRNQPLVTSPNVPNASPASTGSAAPVVVPGLPMVVPGLPQNEQEARDAAGTAVAQEYKARGTWQGGWAERLYNGVVSQNMARITDEQNGVFKPGNYARATDAGAAAWAIAKNNGLSDQAALVRAQDSYNAAARTGAFVPGVANPKTGEWMNLDALGQKLAADPGVGQVQARAQVYQLYSDYRRTRDFTPIQSKLNQYPDR